MVVLNTKDGDAVEMAIATGWPNSACAYWLARLRPVPGYRWTQGELFILTAFLIMLAVGLAGVPVAERVRRLSRAARASARDDFSITVPATGQDELTVIGASFNDAGAEIRRRINDVKDREETHRRFVLRIAEDVPPQLAELEQVLGNTAASADAIRRAHDARSHTANLVAGARLRMRAGMPSSERIDLGRLVTGVTAEHEALANALKVAVDISVPKASIGIVGDEALFERAFANLLENAIQFNKAGGHVSVRSPRKMPAGSRCG